jgi:hypothetical protein
MSIHPKAHMHARTHTSLQAIWRENSHWIYLSYVTLQIPLNQTACMFFK